MEKGPQNILENDGKEGRKDVLGIPTMACQCTYFDFGNTSLMI